MNPGLTRETLTLLLFISKLKLSAKLVSADFDAQYAPAAGRPLYPATDETIEICPLFFFSKIFINSIYRIHSTKIVYFHNLFNLF